MGYVRSSMRVKCFPDTEETNDAWKEIATNMVRGKSVSCIVTIMRFFGCTIMDHSSDAEPPQRTESNGLLRRRQVNKFNEGLVRGVIS